MEAKMQQRPNFFALGAAFLAGEKGLIRLLTDAGYTLTPVKID
jgi:hypothetical protein